MGVLARPGSGLGHPLKGAPEGWPDAVSAQPGQPGQGHLLWSAPLRNLCSGCVEQEPELVINSYLGHRRAGHYPEQSSLGAVINCPDFSPQTLLVA